MDRVQFHTDNSLRPDQLGNLPPYRARTEAKNEHIIDRS